MSERNKAWYRGAPGGSVFREFSYFTKYLWEARVYARAEHGHVFRYRISPKRILFARDIWDAGEKVGISTLTEGLDDNEDLRLLVLQGVAEKGYDAIVMRSWGWIVVIDTTIVELLGKAPTPPRATSETVEEQNLLPHLRHAQTSSATCIPPLHCGHRNG